MMIEMMVGRKLTDQFPKQDVDIKDVVLEVKNLSNQYIHDISFKVASGEIVGIAGLMGAGRTEIS